MQRPRGPVIDYGPFTAQQFIRIRTFLGAIRIPKNMNATIFKQLKIFFLNGIDMSRDDDIGSEYEDLSDDFVHSFNDDAKREIAKAIGVKPSGDEQDILVVNELLSVIFAYVAGVTGA